jgi:hypothetical protein
VGTDQFIRSQGILWTRIEKMAIIIEEEDVWLVRLMLYTDTSKPVVKGKLNVHGHYTI